jgi:hypothetical protein
MLERLKELNGVDRAGTNIQRNVERAVEVAVSRGRLAHKGNGFLGLPAQARVFRLPGDGVTRALAQIAAEEIELAVRHKVEDQFGYQRDALPRAVAELHPEVQTDDRDSIRIAAARRAGHYQAALAARLAHAESQLEALARARAYCEGERGAPTRE